MLESLEKLLKELKVCGCDPDGCMFCEVPGKVEKIADAIQAEVDANYLELPKDEDGVPIHVGDEVEWYEKKFAVAWIEYEESGCWIGREAVGGETPVAIDPIECTHVKPRTVEDVLREFALECMTVKEVRNGVPVIGLDEGNVRDWLEEHDELQLRGDAE